MVSGRCFPVPVSYTQVRNYFHVMSIQTKHVYEKKSNCVKLRKNKDTKVPKEKTAKGNLKNQPVFIGNITGRYLFHSCTQQRNISRYR